MPYVLAVLFLLVLSMAYAAKSGAPWVPTWRRDIERFLALANPQKGELMYELGCGDGRVVVTAAKERGVRGVGVELSILQAVAAKVRAMLSGTGVKIRWRNAFHVNLRDADLVYLFLMPETYEKIRPKLEKELKPGARVVSYVWPIPGWTPAAADRAEGQNALYLYQR